MPVRNVDPIPVDPVSGRPTYDKKKGDVCLVTQRSTHTFATQTERGTGMVVGVSDHYDEEPISMAEPLGDYYDPDAMIYPFKLMIGNQPVDPNTQTVLVPHLFGLAGGPNPYWGKWDWKCRTQ